jgi:hypothetical protein
MATATVIITITVATGIPAELQQAQVGTATEYGLLL